MKAFTIYTLKKWVRATQRIQKFFFNFFFCCKGVPFLEWEPPFVMRKFRATNVMNKPVVCFRRVERVR